MSGNLPVRRLYYITILLGFCVSLTIELTQAYLPTRGSSLLDVINNTLGTAIGAFLLKYGLRIVYIQASTLLFLINRSSSIKVLGSSTLHFGRVFVFNNFIRISFIRLNRRSPSKRDILIQDVYIGSNFFHRLLTCR